MKLDSLIQSLMNDELDGGGSLEKSAETRLLEQLRSRGQVEENPYAGLSDAELFKLAEEVLVEAPAEPDEEAVKLAEDDQRGKIMAHAFTHEFALAKEAMVNGFCRVCKNTPFDIQGSSICSNCQPSA